MRATIGILLGAVTWLAGPAEARPASPFGKIVTVQHGAREHAYRIGRELGAGSLAHVYEGRDLSNGHRVAVKLLNDDLVAMEIPDTFEREADIISKVHNGILPKSFGVGTTAEGRHALVMELIHGKELGHEGMPWKPRSVRQSVRIILKVLQGVRAFERAGLSHNDLRPQNILMHGESADSVKVIDVGTADPEPISEGDLYAVGKDLVYLLTGNPSLDAVPRIANPRLRAVAAKALAPVPANRFHSAREMMKALRPFTSI